MTYIWLLSAFVLAVDRFDRFYEKHATRLQQYQCARDVWFDFGYIEPHHPNDLRRRFFHLKLPSYEWTQDFRRRRWGWSQRVIHWAEGDSVQIQLWPVREEVAA